MTIKNAALIYNPKAGALHGGTSIIQQLEMELRNLGINVETKATTAPGDATRLAGEAVQAGVNALIVCGGDGSINEAVQAMVDSSTVLVVYPCGTANVLAKDLGLTRDPKKVSQSLAAGRTKTISLGRAVKSDNNWQRYFLLMAGIGLDAAMVKNVNLNWKRHLGEGAYFLSAMDYLVRWPLRPFTLTIDGKQYRATYATISNSPSYGGGFTIAPSASLEDDQLDVCIFNSDSRLEYIGYAALALGGRHTRCENVTYIKAQSVSVVSESETFVQLDGDLASALPMNFEIVPDAVRVLALK